MQQHSARILQRPPHTRGLGALGANVVTLQLNGRDRCIYLQRLSQGLEAATDQDLHLVPRLYRQNLITEILRTHDIQVRHTESL